MQYNERFTIVGKEYERVSLEELVWSLRFTCVVEHSIVTDRGIDLTRLCYLFKIDTPGEYQLTYGAEEVSKNTCEGYDMRFGVGKNSVVIQNLDHPSYVELLTCFSRRDMPDRVAMQNSKAHTLWAELGDVPTVGSEDCIDEDWRQFPKGTPREDIWHWFEETYNLSVAEDLMYA